MVFLFCPSSWVSGPFMVCLREEGLDHPPSCPTVEGGRGGAFPATAPLLHLITAVAKMSLHWNAGP